MHVQYVFQLLPFQASIPLLASAPGLNRSVVVMVGVGGGAEAHIAPMSTAVSGMRMGIGRLEPVTDSITSMALTNT